MTRIKALFIAFYPMMLMAVSGYGIYQLSTQGFNLIWVGALLTVMPMLLFFSRIMLLQNMPRTSAHFPLLSALAFIGLAIAIYAHLQLPENARQLTLYSPIVSAIAGTVLFLLYVYWYSMFGRESNPNLQSGAKLPSFPLIDVDGNTVDSEIFSGSPAVLIFFRGNWCPLCMAQIKEIAAQYRELDNLGAKVALIAPQPESHTQKLASKFDVPMHFFSDKDNQAARILGINLAGGLPTGMQVLGYDSETVYPTVIIIDENGTILYTDVTDNYRVRPEPAAFIEILQNR